MSTVSTDTFVLENASEHNHHVDSIKCNLLSFFNYLHLGKCIYNCFQILKTIIE